MSHYPSKINHFLIKSIFLFSFFILASCEKNNPKLISADIRDVTFKKEGGDVKVNVNTDAANWSIDTEAKWVKISQLSGSAGTTIITISASPNTGTETRSAVITLNAGSSSSFNIYISQKSNLYPNYNISPKAPDATGMISNAMQLSKKINFGWNVGNTLEAIGGETNWGNPKISEDLIKLVKKSGFNAIRIPCSWDQYADSKTGLIKKDWLDRVKAIVQLCIDNDVYVILNIHWDGGWLENNVNIAKKEANNARQKAYWEQIATHLRDFDEHLIFAGTNEPNVDNDAEKMDVLMSYLQTFIDAVRSTGGKNAYRVLVFQGPNTDIDATNKLMSKIPVDTVPDRLMAEIHYYTPWNFTGLDKDESWGNMAYYWGKDFHSKVDLKRNAQWGEEADLIKLFASMKTKFVDKGIPVIIGEFGAMRRDNLSGEESKQHLASRAYYLKVCTQQAKIHGLIPFYWDNGGLDQNGSGIFNRRTNSVFDKQSLQSLVLATD